VESMFSMNSAQATIKGIRIWRCIARMVPVLLQSALLQYSKPEHTPRDLPLASQGVQLKGSTPEELGSFIRQQLDALGHAFHETGMKAE
jgi:hypothetical protein